MSNSFELKLLSQNWISGSTDPYGEPLDTTSHGNISLKINGEEISGCQFPHMELGINQSAVALLKSVFENHEPDDNYPIFYHGCWIISTCACRIIDCQVTHLSRDRVRLSQFVVTGGPIKDKGLEKKLHATSITIPNIDYASQILPFAEKALEFLVLPERGLGGDDKALSEFEASKFSQLRDEHRELLERLRAYLKLS